MLLIDPLLANTRIFFDVFGFVDVSSLVIFQNNLDKNVIKKPYILGTK